MVLGCLGLGAVIVGVGLSLTVGRSAPVRTEAVALAQKIALADLGCNRPRVLKPDPDGSQLVLCQRGDIQIRTFPDSSARDAYIASFEKDDLLGLRLQWWGVEGADWVVEVGCSGRCAALDTQTKVFDTNGVIGSLAQATGGRAVDELLPAQQQLDCWAAVSKEGLHEAALVVAGDDFDSAVTDGVSTLGVGTAEAQVFTTTFSLALREVRASTAEASSASSNYNHAVAGGCALAYPLPVTPTAPGATIPPGTSTPVAGSPASPSPGGASNISGEYIAFVREHPDGTEDIYVMGADGSGERYLTEGADPAWSPDGSSIAFVRSDGLYVIDADGGLVHEVEPTADSQSLWAPSWSPDGAQIAFAMRDADGRTSVLVTKADGTDQRFVTPGADPAWSPDGSTVAFDREDGVYVIAATEGQPGLLVPHAFDPEWSPDGTQIAFLRTVDSAGDTGIYLAGADGSGARALIKGITASGLAWAPDGTEIAFAWGRGLLSEGLGTISPTGGRPMGLGAGTGGEPAWSPPLTVPAEFIATTPQQAAEELGQAWAADDRARAATIATSHVLDVLWSVPVGARNLDVECGSDMQGRPACDIGNGYSVGFSGSPTAGYKIVTISYSE